MTLELKIPPVVIVILAIILNYILVIVSPRGILVLPFTKEILLVFGLIGILIAILGVYTFKVHSTTVNPLNPQKVSTLVNNGIYRFTRNPMYLGMACIVFGHTWFCSHVLGILIVIGFIVYMTYFQIIPEEKILSGIFGEDYDDYCKRVRRWL